MQISNSTRPVARAALVAAFVFILMAQAGSPARASAPIHGYEVLDVHPHDETAFTQGLLFADGFLYEGTGLFEESSLRKVDLETGQVLKQYDLPPEFFGEGITAYRDTIYQLTWENYELFKFVEGDEFELVETLPYEWEGWGLTHDGTHLIASDGSATLRFLNPDTLGEVTQVQVQDDGTQIGFLNELEYVQGRIYANVWYSDRIAVIDPGSGAVEAWLDLGGLRDSLVSYPSADVLNGIAVDADETRLFVTGKLWPKLFEIAVPSLDPVAVAEGNSHARNESASLRISPNPCSRWTQLSYSLSGEGPATIRLFDVRGRRVRSIAQGVRDGGEHTVTLDLSGLPAGSYLAMLSSGGMVTSRKLLVVK